MELFIAENAILGERTHLIEQLDEDNYRAVYGTFSTIATASVVLRIINSRSNLAVTALYQWVSACSEHGGVLDATTIGLIVASQALPKFQILLLSKLASSKLCAL
jgi:hypothetical protein